MPFQFKFNKISMQQIQAEVKMRTAALPTLKSKESALRSEVIKTRRKLIVLDEQLHEALDKYENMAALWPEFDFNLVKVKQLKLEHRKISGVDCPRFEGFEFEPVEIFLYSRPAWFAEGIEIAKELLELKARITNERRNMERIEYARKRTTQKVNLYEKVQIPAYNEAILKIKRYLEDEENLGKSAQKMLKKRKEIA